ncbi:MAG: hypothetical protein ACREDV_11955 [Methylocella sp.]
MPTFDGGHYFLTVLVPVKTGQIPDGTSSPVHALRKRLALLPTAQQSLYSSGEQSPFARNTRNHFARFAIIDDVAYNGRQTEDSISLALRNALSKKKINVQAQPQDHLTCPFLLFAADIDAASGAETERDSYLATLWATMEQELREIFVHCERFDSVHDAASFAKYIASCQLETTMPFNDYYVDAEETVKSLPVWPADQILIPAGLGAILFVLGIVVWFIFAGGIVLLLAGAVVLAAGLGLAYVTLLRAGAKPFPAAPDSNLPAVLKALHLQRTFTRFASKHQRLAADPNSAEQFHAAFGDFVADNQPDNLATPTQQPGVIRI